MQVNFHAFESPCVYAHQSLYKPARLYAATLQTFPLLGSLASPKTSPPRIFLGFLKKSAPPSKVKSKASLLRHHSTVNDHGKKEKAHAHGNSLLYFRTAFNPSDRPLGSTIPGYLGPAQI